MIKIQSQVHVAGLSSREVVDFLLNCTDAQYRAWWPGTHLQLHARERFPGDIGNVYYMDEFVGERRLRMTAVVRALEPSKEIVWQLKKGLALPPSRSTPASLSFGCFQSGTGRAREDRVPKAEGHAAPGRLGSGGCAYAVRYLVRDAQRVIESIEALLHIHNAQEQAIYEHAASM